MGRNLGRYQAGSECTNFPNSRGSFLVVCVICIRSEGFLHLLPPVGVPQMWGIAVGLPQRELHCVSCIDLA